MLPSPAPMWLWISSCLLLAVMAGMIWQHHAQQRFADQAQIHSALAGYAHTWDRKDAAGFAALFTQDARMERWVQDQRVAVIEGREALLDYARSAHGGRLADRQTRHHISGTRFVAQTGHSAQTESVVLITHQTANDTHPFVSGTGRYVIEWRKKEGKWLIARRALHSDRVAAAR